MSENENTTSKYQSNDKEIKKLLLATLVAGKGGLLASKVVPAIGAYSFYKYKKVPELTNVEYDKLLNAIGLDKNKVELLNIDSPLRSAALPLNYQKLTNANKISRQLGSYIDFKDLSKLDDAYNKKNLVFSTKKTPAILAHELGHVKNLDSDKLFNKLIAVGYPVGRSLSMIGSPILAAREAYRGAHGEDPDALIYTGVGISTPMLFEEGRASVKGLNALRKVRGWRGALPESLPLALAFGTYGSLSAFPLAANYLGKKFLYKNNTKRSKK